MNSNRDGHVRVLPLHVANKIAAGEVVERPASVVKELVENALDAGARTIRISITAGGRKLVAVQDDGCGMTRDDAVLALERQATSKILDVGDIEKIDTLGFRGEAIPSIASVSRFTITTRRASSDEGSRVQVNAGILAEVSAAGCPPGTLVEVRDLFCNVPARLKFLRAYTTEESHVRQIFTTHALAHPETGFNLTIDGREANRLSPATTLADRIRDLFGADFLQNLLPVDLSAGDAIHVHGYIERPGLDVSTRHEQYVFINGRPATAPSIAYALREAYPRRNGEMRPATVLFIDLPADQVDVNVHPTKREVRFRNAGAVKNAVIDALTAALALKAVDRPADETPPPAPITPPPAYVTPPPAYVTPTPAPQPRPALQPFHPTQPVPPPAPQPVQVVFAVTPDEPRTRPWQWIKFLSQTDSGFVLYETDDGIVTINPRAARERITYEKLTATASESPSVQPLLIPETLTFSPVDFARVKASLEALRAMGFQLEEFGSNVFKVEALPQVVGETAPAALLATIAHDLETDSSRRNGARWREELIAKSLARQTAGSLARLTPDGARQLVEELSACRTPYVSPRGKPVMTFTSNRKLKRDFDLD